MNKLKLAAALAVSVLPNAIKLAAYRRVFGAKIGRGVRVGFGCVLVADRLELGDGTRLGPFNYINVRSLQAGKHVHVGSFTRISTGSVELRSRAIVDSWVSVVGDRRSPAAKLELGMHSWLFPYCYVNTARSVKLGRNVGVGGGSYIFTHGVWLSALEGFPVKYGPVEIGDDTWLPWGCFIMPDVTLGRRVVVGARSTVNKSFPDDALIAGTPAKLIKDRSSRDVSTEERTRLLLDLTRELAGYQGEPFEERREAGSVRLSVGGRELVRVFERMPERGALSDDALNVLPGALVEAWAKAVPCLFLDGSGSSSESMFDARVRAWLGHARRIGVRYYPVDED